MLGLIGDETLPDAGTAPSPAAGPAAPAAPPAPEVDLMGGFDDGEGAVPAAPAPSADDLIGACGAHADAQRMLCCRSHSAHADALIRPSACVR